MNQLARKEPELHVLTPEIPATPPARRKQISFRLSKSKLPLLVVVFLLVYLAVTFSSQFKALSSMQREVSDIEHQVFELKQKNEELRGELRRVQSDAFIEKTAREQLGLVKSGETRIIAIPEGTELKKLQSPEGNSGGDH